MATMLAQVCVRPKCAIPTLSNMMEWPYVATTLHVGTQLKPALVSVVSSINQFKIISFNTLGILCLPIAPTI